MRNKKIIVSTLVFTLTQSCNMGGNVKSLDTTTTMKSSLVDKVTYNSALQKEPQKLTFSSKAVIKELESTSKVPEKKATKIELTTEKDDDKQKIRIPKIGDFKITFQKGSNFKVLDRDATDGEAIVQMPEFVMEGFVKVSDEGESKASSKITLEDKLYYQKKDFVYTAKKDDDKFKVKDDKTEEKDKWYRLGNKPFPVPNEWYSDDGNKYVLRFSNSGVKKLEFNWFKSEKADFPAGINEITPESGGVVELAGVGKMEVPAGSVSQKTVMVMKEEKNVPEIDDPSELYLGNTKKIYDYASPVVRIEPKETKLNLPVKVYLNSNMDRVGNNTPYSVWFYRCKDLISWYPLSYPDLENVTHDSPTTSNELGYFSKLISPNIKPDSEMIYDFVYELINSNFSIKAKNKVVSVILAQKGIIDEPIRKKFEEKAGIIYEHHKNVAKLAHFLDPFSVNGKPVIITINSINDTPETSTDGSINTDINFSAIPHEMWHSFQFAFSNFNWQEPYNLRYMGKFWAHESTAMYVGAQTEIEKFPNENDQRTAYAEYLKGGLDNINRVLPYVGNWSGVTKENYYGVGYVSYIVSKNGMFAVNTIPASVDESYFHDYALSAYLQDTFLTPPEKKSTKENDWYLNYLFKLETSTTITNSTPSKRIYIDESNTDTNPRKLSGSLFNNSAEYFKIESSKYVNNHKFGIRLTSTGDCGKSLKAKVLLYKNKNDNPTNYKELREIFVQNKEESKWTKIDNFENDVSSIVLILSNSMSNINYSYLSSCNYNMYIAERCK